MRIVPLEKTLILRLDVFFAGPRVPTSSASPARLIINLIQQEGNGGGGEGREEEAENVYLFFPDVTLVRSMENKDFSSL